MAIIKSYTDLEQSKKLAEFLPLESADCFWDYDDLQKYHRINLFEEGYDKDSQLRTNENNVCAWSLAALLGVLLMIDFTTPQLVGTPKTLYRCMYNDNLKSHAYDNPVDACYEMIVYLHELNLL